MTRTRAFTLVELLVVVTLITVLVSMLTPAVERAMYHANLAKCASNLKTIASAGTLYASDNHGRYPLRVNQSTGERFHQDPIQISNTFTGPPYDMRPMLTPYTSLDAFVDPLSHKVDLRPEATDQPLPSVVFATYYVFFGWGPAADAYPDNDMMDRLGQKFSHGSTRFNIVASDQDEIQPEDGRPTYDGAHVTTSHRAHPKQGPAVPLQNQDFGHIRYTRSYYQRNGWTPGDRGQRRAQHAKPNRQQLRVR